MSEFSSSQGLSWFLQHRALLELLLTFGGMLLLMMVETVMPRVQPRRVPVARWFNNWALAIFNYFFLLWLAYLVTVSALAEQWGAGESGLLQGVHPVVAFAGVFIVLEGMVYALHRAFHQVPLLWRLHAVHHLDTEVDVTTAHRHHTLELVIVSMVLVPVILLLAPPTVVLLAYFMLRGVVVLLSHSNLYLPERADRWLRRVVVTPDFHRLHHAADQRYTDSNYGTVTPWFDYLFGTATDLRFQGHERLVTGLEYLRRDGDSRVDRLLLLPLRWRQRVRRPGPDARVKQR